MTFEFQLRKGVTRHDGEPFTSADVVFTLNAFKKHPYCWVSVDAVAEAGADGPHRVKVRLKYPYEAGTPGFGYHRRG